jgi:hypothetical protein
MALYKKNISLGGSWAKASELLAVKLAKIVSETNPMPSSFTNKDGSPKFQDVCKVQFEGFKEPLNVSLNRATINGLVDAFGEDSKDWQNKNLSVETEKVRVAGKAVTALYLIPSGYKRIDDENGYPVIINTDKEVSGAPLSEEDIVNAEINEVNAENIPF